MPWTLRFTLYTRWRIMPSMPSSTKLGFHELSTIPSPAQTGTVYSSQIFVLIVELQLLFTFNSFTGQGNTSSQLSYSFSCFLNNVSLLHCSLDSSPAKTTDGNCQQAAISIYRSLDQSQDLTDSKAVARALETGHRTLVGQPCQPYPNNLCNADCGCLHAIKRNHRYIKCHQSVEPESPTFSDTPSRG